ncbi:MAG TPA: DUF364 domain-containing protein [Holophaga sp.]|nr:DUF364 domain-containing protein [Holophaga sp.]
MTLTIQARLLEHLTPHAEGVAVADVRIGLGYTAIRLDSGHAGVAWTPTSDAPCCTHFQGAGTLAGQPAGNLLSFLLDGKPGLARAIGMATANALLARLPHPPASREDVVSILAVQPGERVAMVGYFGPVVTQLRKLGCRLDIVELRPRAGETLGPDQGREVLAACDVAILTGTSLINGTADDLLASLGRPRAAVLLGPSSPLCPAPFLGTKITHLAGARVREADAVLRIVSEGGGTMLLKKHMDFETVPVGPA